MKQIDFYRDNNSPSKKIKETKRQKVEESGSEKDHEEKEQEYEMVEEDESNIEQSAFEEMDSFPPRESNNPLNKIKKKR